MVNYNTQKFIDKAEKIHGKKYNYLKVEYEKSNEKIIIECPIHGEFNQLPNNHLQGQGCPKCGIIKNQNKNLKNIEFFLKVKKIHQNKYNYKNSVYLKSYEKISIECPIHGKFQQTPKNHLLGCGCPKCGNKKQFNDIDIFYSDLKLIHNNFYEYPKKDYYKSSEKISIECPIHGEFQQRAYAHKQGQKCPKCVNIVSKSEQEIYDFIKSLGIDNVQQSNRTILNNKELDIYLPDYNLGIEFNGLYWHNEDYKEDNYHQKKTDECLSKNIQLIQIFEDEWLHKKDIVKSRLINLIHKIESNKIIYARKCFIKEIDSTFARKFTERNHLQGFVGAKTHLGLFYIIDNKEYLVSYMSFGNLRKNLGQKEVTDNHYELLRFCNVINYRVIGGASKLLKYFEKNYKPEKIISYADRRWSNGNLYNQLGFTQSHISKPNYYYVDGLKRHNRFGYRKDILISKYDCKPEMTERDFCRNILGLTRIYDAGNLVYEK